jgi:hypothetical protein
MTAALSIFGVLALCYKLGSWYGGLLHPTAR